jgi:hypothetical protein
MSARTIRLQIVDPKEPSVNEGSQTRLVDREIAGHGRSWCSADCRDFLPGIYRAFRMCGCSPASLQETRGSCHTTDAKNELDQEGSSCAQTSTSR